jgi:two-component system, response regulator
MGARKVILLVEDNIDDEVLTLRALKKSNVGHEVVVARNGEEALAYLFRTEKEGERDISALPQLTLLDLNLPKLDGLGVLRRIRADETTRFMPVIIMTSSKQEEDIVNSYALGANAYVRKPVDFAQFTEGVKTLGLFWLLLNEVPEPPAAQ